MDIEEIKTKYIALNEQKEEILIQLKPISKELRGLEKDIKTYMTDNGLESLVVGEHLFEAVSRTSLRITPEDLEEILPEGVDLQQYMKERNSITKKRKKSGE